MSPAKHPSPPPKAEVLEPEDRLDSDTIVAHRYRILRFAGNRGFGQVYQAEDSATDASVSLMRLDREFSRPGVRDRFFETRGSAQIEHVGAVDLVDYGEDLDGRLFLVMPWIAEAEALDELLTRESKLGWPRARGLFEQIAAAIAAAHARGILHGGLEPSRVLIDADGRAHVLDFGLAPALESAAHTNGNKPAPRITDTRVLAGKPAYMPPELVRGDPPTDRSDIYALGLMLWELVSGSPPFTGDPVDTLHKQIHDPLPELVRGDAPSEVEAFLHLALAKEPDERFASVTELLETLRSLPGASVGPQPLARTKTEPLAKPAAPKLAIKVPASRATAATAGSIKASKPTAAAPSSKPAAAAPALVPMPARAEVAAPVPAPAPEPVAVALPELDVAVHASAREPSAARALVVTPARKRRFGLLEIGIAGFLLFDLALFGAWKLLAHPSKSSAAEPIAQAESARAPDEPQPASKPAPAPAPTLAEPAPTPTPAPAAPAPELGPELEPELEAQPLDELPKQLSDADFRKTMVDARDLIAIRCLDDQRLRRTLKVSLDVAPSGEVERAKIVGALASTALGKCVARQAKRVEFPPSLEGGSHVYALHLR